MTFETQLLNACGREGEQAARSAAKLLRAGELVAIPTETVYGLAANALDSSAVEKIFAVKGRPQDNPLIVHIDAPERLETLVSGVTEQAKALARRFWPGPLTIVLPRGKKIPDAVTAGLDTVAVRLPSHPVARAVIKAAGLPLAAPSANLSGKPSPTTAAHCMADLNGKIPLILDGGPCDVGLESTVIALDGPVPRVLRPGAITVGQLREVLGTVEVDSAVLEQLPEDATAASPGMKYLHYSPKAEVVLLNGGWEACRQVLEEKRAQGVWALVFDEELADCPVPALSLGPREDYSRQARELFSALRELDDKNAVTVYARQPGKEGVGLAVLNRLVRAAGFRRINAGDGEPN